MSATKRRGKEVSATSISSAETATTTPQNSGRIRMVHKDNPKQVLYVKPMHIPQRTQQGFIESEE